MFEEVKELLLNTITSPFSYDSERNRTRKIIFWYDSKCDYEELIDEIELENTEIIKYNNNSFWIRYHIEKEELDKNIVIYFPFDNLKGKGNDLLDLETANFDLTFNPDSTTMRLKNLNLSDECRDVIKKYSKFFNDKKRENKFKEFDVEKTADNIDYIITSIILGIKSITIDDILKNIIKIYFSDKKKYEEVFKLGDIEFILSLFNNYFGSDINNIDNLPDIYKSLIFTYFVADLKDVSKVSRFSKYILKKKLTNVYVFVNSLMRDETTKEYFEILSTDIEREFGIGELIESLEIDIYKASDAFKCIDNMIINYLIDKLFNGMEEFNLYKEYITLRESKYFANALSDEYSLLKVSINFAEKMKKVKDKIKFYDIDEFVKVYIDNLYEIDTLYRKMYYYYDKISDKDIFIDLKNKIENIYVNNFMSELSIKWSEAIENMCKYDSNRMIMQNKFYNKFVLPYNDKKDRVIVIVSDAFRYECAKELNDKLKSFSNKSEINYMLGVVPSYTKLGMASLLPNKKLERVQDSDDILVDGILSSALKDREIILQKEEPESIVIKYEDIYEMTKMDWKKTFSGKKVIYIYHNVVDNMGEHNENKLFDACDNAIIELEKLIRDLHTTFSGVNVFVTADHGFFYKRSKVEAHEKTAKDINSIKQKTRYSYSNEKSNEEGILSINMNYLFEEDIGYLNIPRGNIVFSRQGSGINYFHGGILPQEIIVPVIDFKSKRNVETSKNVGITYSGLTSKITNSITYLEFLQDSNIDENNKTCRYLLHFEDDNGNKVSDQCTIIANYENTEVKDRFFKEKFVFKNIEYDRNKVYYLVIADEETGIELPRIKFYIDIAITNNFDF